MKVGDRVQVLPCLNYGGRFTGRLGAVIYLTGLCPNKVGIKIDGLENQASKYGAYWFALSDVQIIESEEMGLIMEHSTLMPCMTRASSPAILSL